MPTRETLLGGGEPCAMNDCCEGAGENGDGDCVATRFGGGACPPAGFCGLYVWFCMTGDGLAVAEPTCWRCEWG